MMNQHMVTSAKGARHHVVRGGRRHPPLRMWSPIVVLALASANFIGFGPSYFIVLLALAPTYIKGQAGPNNHILEASPYNYLQYVCNDLSNAHS